MNARDDAAEQVKELVAGLGIKYGFERSFRLSARLLLAHRFLLGFRKQRLGEAADQRILDICERLEMPHILLDGYRARLPDSQYVHFGFEQNESNRLYKAYLEFYEQVEAQMQSRPGSSDLQLMHLGFKWAAAGDRAPVLTSYVWHPFLSVESMLERVADLLGPLDTGALMDVTRGVLHAAAERVSHRDIFYMEATEEGNPRHSFDINMYRARLRMEELDPIFARLSGHFDLPAEEYRGLRDGSRACTFGHVAGGIDRTGRDFLTVYYGLEYLEPPGPQPASMIPWPPLFRTS